MAREEKPGDDAPPDNHHVKIQSADDAVSFLLEKLRKANLLFASGKDARAGAVAAQDAVIQFVSFFEGTIDLCQPLIAIQNALLSLEDGQVLPLLKKRERHGGAPASTARENDMGHAAITVHRLCEIGMNRDEACEMVAKVCREAGIKRTRRGKERQSGPRA